MTKEFITMVLEAHDLPSNLFEIYCFKIEEGTDDVITYHDMSEYGELCFNHIKFHHNMPHIAIGIELLDWDMSLSHNGLAFDLENQFHYKSSVPQESLHISSVSDLKRIIKDKIIKPRLKDFIEG